MLDSLLYDACVCSQPFFLLGLKTFCGGLDDTKTPHEKVGCGVGCVHHYSFWGVFRYLRFDCFFLGGWGVSQWKIGDCLC